VSAFSHGSAGAVWRVSSRTGGLVALALVIALLPFALTNNYFYEVAILVGLNAIVCVGLNLLIGYAGQISLGHAGFFGMGAYGSALLTSRYGWPPLVALTAATAGVALVAFVVGRPILRLKGHYLAMATLGLGIIVSIVISTEDVRCGPCTHRKWQPRSSASIALTTRSWFLSCRRRSPRLPAR
jgi:branched-chain amino acid transport system permease protein